MKLINHTFYPLAALSMIATGVFSTPAAADLEVVAVLATQTRLTDNVAVFELDADKQVLHGAFISELATDLGDRLAAEFESAQRSAALASDFSEQILDALDERLPGEVGNLIAAAD